MLEFKMIYDGNENLYQKSEEFSFEKYDKEFRNDLTKTIANYCFDKKALGLSGVQFSFPYRVLGCFVNEKEFVVMYNPVIKEVLNKEKVKGIEGCLSFPALELSIPREQTIHIEYQDDDGKLNDLYLDEFFARIFLHELDHLNGITFDSYMKPLALKMARKKQYKRLKNMNLLELIQKE